VIYLDTSVALAQLFAEDRRPPVSLWSETLVSSRLLEYELWTRVNARGLAKAHGETVRGLLGRIAFVEMARPVLERALEPFATPVRTLDALHLASMEFLRQQGQQVALASYDDRLVAAAKRMKFSAVEL
jgi:predicted nucleic acid-binding protein